MTNKPEKSVEEMVEEAYKKGHADALRTIPFYETNNLTQPNNPR